MHHDVICFASVHQLLLGPAVHMSSTMVDSEHCATSCWDCVIMFLNILPTICIYSELHYFVSAWWKYVASVASNPQKAFLVPFLFRFWHFFQAAVCLQDLAQCSQWTKNSWSGQSWKKQCWWEASWKDIADAHRLCSATVAAKLQASVAVHTLLFMAHYTCWHEHS